MMKNRSSGIQLHITSLPSKYGIGDFGPEAYKFADFLAAAGQSYWQILPLNQINPRDSYSPYSCMSAFAGNTLLISPELLCHRGLLTKKDISDIPTFTPASVNFHSVYSYKTRLLHLAYSRFKSMPTDSNYEKFCAKNKNWLENYAIFSALRSNFRSRLWCDWPVELRGRKKSALKSVRPQLQDIIDREKFFQCVFFEQWFALKKYCNRRGIKIIGDIPLYVDYDSADVWRYPDNFKLTKAKKPHFIAGVPPDYYSRTGQLWNNPVYNWKVLKDTGYLWWFQRIKHSLAMFDIVRLDHFRGFFAYWQVPAKHKTAVNGKWVKVPGEDFLKKLFKYFPKSCFIAEDLGCITADVRAAIKKYKLVSTKVLLFAFNRDSSVNPHFPGSYPENSVVYTSTHDSNTIKGWFMKEAGYQQKKNLFEYLGRKVSVKQIHWELIHLAMKSVSDTVIIPLQDILGLGEDARMNRPATTKGNWKWRFRNGRLKPATIRKLAKLTRIYGRA